MHIALMSLGDFYFELFNFEQKTNPLPDYRKDVMNDLHTVGTKHICLRTDDLAGTLIEMK